MSTHIYICMCEFSTNFFFSNSDVRFVSKQLIHKFYFVAIIINYYYNNVIIKGLSLQGVIVC